MAFNAKGLVSIASVPNITAGSSNRIYTYFTNDTAGTVEGSGYFNAKVDDLVVGDMIWVSGDLDGTPFHKSYLVSSNNGTTVGITAGTTATFTERVVLCYNGLSSKASDAAVARFVAPYAGTITKVYTVLNGALATANATFTTAIGGVGVTNGVVTAIQSGSAAGDVASATPSAARTVAAGDLITVTGGGGSTATATANVFVIIDAT